MEQLEGFVWYGDKGEQLRFADSTPAEQRVALIATGGLLRDRQKMQEQKMPDTEDQVQKAA